MNATKVFFILLVIAFVLCAVGCTTLAKDCEQQGNSQYYHCKTVWLSR